MDFKKSTCWSQETEFKHKNVDKFKGKGWKKMYHVNNDQKEVGVSILISK